MVEEIVINSAYQHVILNWKDRWYKIPLMVIKDEAEAEYKSFPPSTVQTAIPLMVWYTICEKGIPTNDQPEIIKVFKEMFSGRMPRMEAYLMYNVNDEPNGEGTDRITD